MSEIKGTHTACAGCSLAVWDKDTQTGCLLNRPERFRAHDPSHVVEAYEDQGKNFFIINGRLCKAFRPKAWADKREGQDLGAAARAELRLRVACVVLMTDGRFRRGALARTANSLAAQTLPPHQVLFVNQLSTATVQQAHDKLWDVLGNRLTWRVVRVFDKGADEGDLVDAALRQADRACTHYAVFHAGCRVPPGFLESVDRALNDGLERFSVLEPTARGNGLFVQREVHEHPYIAGNAAVEYAAQDDEEGDSPEGEGGVVAPPKNKVLLKSLLDKARAFAARHGCPAMVRPVTDYCPELR